MATRAPLAPLRAISVLILGLGLFYASLLVGIALMTPPPADLPETIDLILPEDRVTGSWQPSGEETVIKAPMHVSGDGYFYDDPDRKGGGYFLIPFTLEAERTDPMVLYLDQARRTLQVQLNGEPIYALANRHSHAGHGGFIPVNYTLPPELLRAGENLIVVTDSGLGRKVQAPWRIGEPEELVPPVMWGQIQTLFLPAMAVALLSLAALLYLTVSWPQQERARARALVVLMVAWAVYALNSVWWPVAIPAPWRQLVGYIQVFVLCGGVLLVTATWLRLSARWIAAILLLVGIVSAIATLAAMVSSDRLFDTAFPIEKWGKVAVAGGAIAALTWHRMRTREDDGLAVTALITCLAAILWDGLDDITPQHVPLFPDLAIVHYLTPRYGIVLAFGSLAAVATQFARARRILAAHSDILAERLAAREAELNEAHERERGLARARAILEERQRIMRDMHDGIGGHLVSLIVQARGGDVRSAEMVKALQSALDELRLIVDSLDTAGDSLAFALGAFRERLEPKLRAAGIRLAWRIDREAAAVELGPEAVLQIFRILQEACSNAIQHSGADELEIALDRTGEESGAALRLVVADTGRGLPDTGPIGKGLANMRARAARLGAQINIENLARGVRVSLDLPVRGVPQPA